MADLTDQKQLIGKTDAELLWESESCKLSEIDEFVFHEAMYVCEEKYTVANDGVKTFLTVKNQTMGGFFYALLNYNYNYNYNCACSSNA